MRTKKTKVKKVKTCLTCGKEFAFTSITSNRQYCSRFCNPQRQKYNISSETIKFESAAKNYRYFRENLKNTYRVGQKIECKHIYNNGNVGHTETIRGIITQIKDFIVYIKTQNSRIEPIIINDIYTQHSKIQLVGGF